MSKIETWDNLAENTRQHLIRKSESDTGKKQRRWLFRLIR